MDKFGQNRPCDNLVGSKSESYQPIKLCAAVRFVVNKNSLHSRGKVLTSETEESIIPKLCDRGV